MKQQQPISAVPPGTSSKIPICSSEFKPKFVPLSKVLKTSHCVESARPDYFHTLRPLFKSLYDATHLYPLHCRELRDRDWQLLKDVSFLQMYVEQVCILILQVIFKSMLTQPLDFRRRPSMVNLPKQSQFRRSRRIHSRTVVTR